MKIVIVFLIICSSCSSMKKSKIYGTSAGVLVGGLLGGFVGKELSPNSQSDQLNTLLGSGIGALSFGAGGYYIGKNMYSSNPENFKGDPIKIKKIKKDQQTYLINNDLGLNKINIDTKKSIKKAYEVEIENKLPNHLKQKVLKQVVIEHLIPAQEIKLDDGRLIYFEGTTAIEHRYLSQKEGL
jgi:hypothetical protein